ncbi:hypothetical protein Ocin01_07780 [Orchesella cincta]|uniref:Uncharacterized protein n=1 Tax=Orchesella cincta TaxID=48709 RepID=A0A1D2N0U4_ORCCI|nr:hypothetical protein Ocin01_07780 [Orchesella cincta]
MSENGKIASVDSLVQNEMDTVNPCSTARGERAVLDHEESSGIGPSSTESEHMWPSDDDASSRNSDLEDETYKDALASARYSAAVLLSDSSDWDADMPLSDTQNVLATTIGPTPFVNAEEEDDNDGCITGESSLPETVDQSQPTSYDTGSTRVLNESNVAATTEGDKPQKKNAWDAYYGEEDDEIIILKELPPNKFLKRKNAMGANDSAGPFKKQVKMTAASQETKDDEIARNETLAKQNTDLVKNPLYGKDGRDVRSLLPLYVDEVCAEIVNGGAGKFKDLPSSVNCAKGMLPRSSMGKPRSNSMDTLAAIFGMKYQAQGLFTMSPIDDQEPGPSNRQSHQEELVNRVSNADNEDDKEVSYSDSVSD